MHTCDVSVPTRDFHVVKNWTYLLFEEFFEQGDLEKEKGLPVSMLCDRNTTHVAKSQPGFINFVTLPLYQNLVHIMPNLSDDLKQLQQNLNTWKNYNETEEDKKVYEKKSKVIAIEVSKDDC